jgi:hypothetical protein
MLNKYYKKADDIFNDSSLSQNLYKGLAKAFNNLLEETKEDELYAFGIFTSGEYRYAEITANSFWGLDQIVKEYKDDSFYSEVSVYDLKNELKWSPCDWHYHCVITNNELDEVDTRLKELYEISEKIINKHEDFESALNLVDTKIIQRLNKLFCDCLKKLKNENSFESKNVVFSIWLGDQPEEERVNFISKINDEKLSQKYISESRIGYETYESRQ